MLQQGLGTTGLSPSPTPPSRGLGLSPPLRTLLHTTIQTSRATDSHGWIFPVRSPLLRESLLVSLPPLIDILKLSGRPTYSHGSKSCKAGGSDTHDQSQALAQPPSITVPSTVDSVFNQPLDGSWDSAIHTKYRISLRSSSMPESRYLVPRVFRISMSQLFLHEHRLRADGGELNDFNFLGAFHARVLLLGQEDTVEGVVPPNTRGTEVQWTSHKVADSEPSTSSQSRYFIGPLNRQITPPTKNGHAPPPIESRKSSQFVNPYYVWTFLATILPPEPKDFDFS
ncbi:hypothetical protein TanjilG_14718 [Lupinus angustifolius]|nr:hypothetical protein TanjilG_14718 [Lupinus angustifolius]